MTEQKPRPAPIKKEKPANGGVLPLAQIFTAKEFDHER
jgi:hypothetical protein